MSPNDAHGMANSVGADQEQSDLGLHCLPRHICPKNLDHYGTRLGLAQIRELNCIYFAI